MDLIVKPKDEIIANPFDVEQDDLEWLELGDIPQNIANPLVYPIGSKIPDPADEMVRIFTNKDYLHFAAKMILGIELPPFQAVIIDALWTHRMPLMVGSRGLSKSFSLAVYCLLRMVLSPGCRIVIVGAGLRQARQVYDYMVWIWERAPVLRDIAGKGQTVGPRREVDRFQFTIGNSIATAIPLGQGDKIRGLRANHVICDETAVIPEQIFNVVVQGFAVVAKDPVSKIKEAATIRRLKQLGQWSDEMDKFRRENNEGNQIILAGTGSYAFNHFYKNYKKYKEIITSRGDAKLIKNIFDGDEKVAQGFNWRDFVILRIPYTHVPEGMLDPGIVAQAKATLTRSQFLLEYGASFITDSDGFYKRSVLENATTNRPIVTPDGPVQFSAMKQGDPKKSHVIGVDPAADADNAAIVVLEINQGHRKIVNCWTTNRKKYNKLKASMRSQGIEIGDNYYSYIAKKIRQLMSLFNTERIIMDKNGGGRAIAEVLSSFEICGPNESPIYEIVNPDDPKPDDVKRGLHILELLSPNSEINSDANHGMLKDFQSQILLFPMFDTVELAKAIEMDKLITDDDKFDTYEDLVQEIEELKSEITSVVVTPSSTLGKETFDTPSIKTENDKKGRLRKDRYSALLYANYYVRNKDKDSVLRIEYRALGATKDTINRDPIQAQRPKSMYYGPGLLKFGSKNKWLSQGGATYIKHHR